MIRHLFIASAILMLTSGCAAPGTSARAVAAPAGLPANIVKMLSAVDIPTDAVGALVIRLSDGTTILSHRPDASLQPASTMKLLTTAIGLEKLGPTKRWHTELRTSAPVEDGVLRGDLILRGGGDGDLTWEAFNGMLRSLHQKGIRDIRGDLVLDRQMFQPSRSDIGVPPFDDAPDAEYNVIPDALLINTNLLKFELESNDQSMRARMTPELEGVSIELQMKLIDRACADWEGGWESPGYVKGDDGSIRIQLRGVFPGNCSATTSVNILERDEFIDRLFRRLWTELGGSFRGRTRDDATPVDSRLLSEHHSRTLADMLRKINKPSDNPLTRLLFLTLGTLDRGAGTSLNKADRQVRDGLATQGIRDAGLVTENGSGLSRKERLRPSQLAALLVAAYRSNWAPEFLSSLPVVGLDGTMRERLRDSPVAGRARMKTGTLNNVVALAGYVPDAAGQVNVVVAIINYKTPTGELWPIGRPILDALVDWVGHTGAKPSRTESK